jgi:hypothetical protein
MKPVLTKVLPVVLSIGCTAVEEFEHTKEDFLDRGGKALSEKQSIERWAAPN